LGLRGDARQKEFAAPALPDKPSLPEKWWETEASAEPQRRMRVGIERGIQMYRCERTREQPATELLPRDACELATTTKRDGSCMRANLQLRPTFEVSGVPKARPLDRRVGRAERYD